MPYSGHLVSMRACNALTWLALIFITVGCISFGFSYWGSTTSSIKDWQTLQYFDHVYICTRSGNNLEKNHHSRNFEGSRKRGRPKLRWGDGLKEITSNSLNALYRLTNDKCQWKNLITWVTTSQPWINIHFQSVDQ